MADELTVKRERVSLNDLSHIQEILRDYLDSCVMTSTIPSITGFCRALGISRTAYYRCLNSKQPAETSEFFEEVHDAFSDTLSQCGLRGVAQPVVTIFLGKALYGLRDSTELVVSQKTESPLGVAVDQKALEAKLSDIVLDDE